MFLKPVDMDISHVRGLMGVSSSKTTMEKPYSKIWMSNIPLSSVLLPLSDMFFCSVGHIGCRLFLYLLSLEVELGSSLTSSVLG